MFFTYTCAWIQGLLKKGFLNNNEKIVYIISSYKNTTVQVYLEAVMNLMTIGVFISSEKYACRKTRFLPK
jgi:hypothetical protein